MHVRTLLAALLLTSPLAAPDPLHGQTEDAVVPMDLVLGLMLGRSQSNISVGAVPPSLVGVLPFDDLGRVVGGQANRDGTTGTVVIAVAGPAREALGRMDDWMPAQGWSRSEVAFDPFRRGFLSTRTPSRFNGWCGPAHMASVQSVSARDSELIRIDLRSMENSPCDSEQAQMLEYQNQARRAMTGDDLLPILPPMEGASVDRRGSGSSGGNAGSSAMIRTARPVAEVFSHYNNAMEADGWRRLGQALGTNESISRWEKEIPERGPTIAVLSVWERRTGEIDASVQVTLKAGQR